MITTTSRKGICWKSG